MSQDRRALDAAAIALMLGLTALWGFQQVTIKMIAADVSFVMQAAIRSMVATLLILAWARLTKESLWGHDGAHALRGVVFLSEPLSAHFAAAALLIATGIALVNFRR